ncbi:MAG: tRNA pseudouridine(38-40) synthase TruA [Lachnospiraceae bacterium]|nr:tRNA pseudouridine(38-40) synthase TruA [Lachnospiraceae bacterium]
MDKQEQKRRILLVVAYDGTNYHGWQLQPESITIEGVLNETLSSLFQEEIQVIGASRTDAGVHAYGNVAVFDTTARIPAEKIPYALNRKLPEDIRIQKAVQVAEDFHPRRCESRKTYEYRILNTKFQIPQKRLYSHWTYYDLDVERMQQAAECLMGEHDFKSFCSVNTQAESTVRTIYELNVYKKEGSPEEIVIRVTGNGFLYNMVRIIAGTLIEVGRGRLEPEDVMRMLEAKDRQSGGPTAPARGLTLVEYHFVELEDKKLEKPAEIG